MCFSTREDIYIYIFFYTCGYGSFGVIQWSEYGHFRTSYKNIRNARFEIIMNFTESQENFPAWPWKDHMQSNAAIW